MKTQMMSRIALMFFFIGLAFSLQASAIYLQPGMDASEAVLQGPTWERLGMRKVNYGLDRDEIAVTIRDGRFTAVKLKVLKSPINMHKMVIHFGNGESHEVELRHNIPAGGETRVIDLPGGKRVISKVVFWYDTKGIMKPRGSVALWGRH